VSRSLQCGILGFRGFEDVGVFLLGCDVEDGGSMFLYTAPTHNNNIDRLLQFKTLVGIVFLHLMDIYRNVYKLRSRNPIL
jgi:hypothetical protein